MIKACEILKIRHLPCFAHTLNLVVQDNFSAEPAQAILKRCKEIVKFFKSSCIAYDKFNEVQVQEWKSTVNKKKEPYKLVQEVPTRWNSCFYIIQRILKTSESLNKTLLKIRKAPTPLTIDEISILGDFEKVLGCFEEATKKISGNSYVTISMIIPMVYGIHNNLESEIMGTEIGNNFRLGLFESISKRLFQYESRSLTRISTIIDPRFKKEAFRMKENTDQASILLENEITVYARQEKSKSGNGNCDNGEFEQPKPKKKHCLILWKKKLKGKLKMFWQMLLLPKDNIWKGKMLPAKQIHWYFGRPEKRKN
ncbi:unnamed protein product [Diabrotica balteata]|uniref:Zinc finger BED domain-containing protein 4 n=1 Tax=Diabrotica balteata TaxID=107213 RepID=A0A9N9XIG2_DIABA|nr:unnamed protein product [Diabrotica balteata]